MAEQDEDADARIGALEAELAAVYASRSWRATGALRRMTAALRRKDRMPGGTAGKGVRTGARPSLARQVPAQPDGEILQRLDSLEAWQQFRQASAGRIFGGSERITEAVLAQGITSRFFGYIPAHGVKLVGEDPREGLIARGLNARQRAVLEIFAARAEAGHIYKWRIYAHEGVTKFALAMRGRYPYFIGSEYAEDEDAAARFWPVPAVDIARSQFPDGSFDFVLSNDVLEHVPELDATLLDTARILKPSGRLIAHFPFLWDTGETQVRARRTAAGVEHILPPEYHGNPVNNSGGSLVFQLPGWDILARCKAAGFRDAWMWFYSSVQAGITGREISGTFILEAER
jgi:SAM-dependent methyltransferase